MNLDAILLAMLREPTTGYDLKAEFDTAAKHFWPAEISQIYRTLKRLEQHGLLRSRVEPSDRGPERRVYTLTAAGTRGLREQLSAEPQLADERLGYIAQLFFLHLLDDLAATRRFIEQLREQRARQVETYIELLGRIRAEAGGSLDNASDELFHQHACLEAGISVARARLRWCDATMRRIDDRIQARIRDEKPARKE